MFRANVAGLRPGTVWADISTIGPDAGVALAERVRAVEAWFLDCPVSGSPATLAAGPAFDHTWGWSGAGSLEQTGYAVADEGAAG